MANGGVAINASPVMSRYTHRNAVSNRRLVAADGNPVTSKYKFDYSTGRLLV